MEQDVNRATGKTPSTIGMEEDDSDEGDVTFHLSRQTKRHRALSPGAAAALAKETEGPDDAAVDADFGGAGAVGGNGVVGGDKPEVRKLDLVEGGHVRDVRGLVRMSMRNSRLSFFVSLPLFCRWRGRV